MFAGFLIGFLVGAGSAIAALALLLKSAIGGDPEITAERDSRFIGAHSLRAIWAGWLLLAGMLIAFVIVFFCL